MKPKILAVIPARGGSKGIKNKNLKKFLGRSLIAYAILAAKKSKLITDIVVSSDSEKILGLARQFGLVVIKRPKFLATDKASSIDAVIHAVFQTEKLFGYRYDLVVMLQPTTPLKTAKDIDQSLQKLIASRADSVISVVRSPGINPEWMKYIVNDQLVDIDNRKIENASRQKDQIYIRNGAIYATRRNTLVHKKTFKGGHCLPYVMPTELWVNIDGPRDWKLAELIMKNKINYDRPKPIQKRFSS